MFIWIDRPSPPVLLAALGMPRTAEPGPAPGPPTEEELHWLAEWVDEQLAPEAVTLEQASAALAARRSCPAGSSHAGSSSASTGFIRLYEVQLQRAKLSAAQTTS